MSEVQTPNLLIPEQVLVRCGMWFTGFTYEYHQGEEANPQLTNDPGLSFGRTGQGARTQGRAWTNWFRDEFPWIVLVPVGQAGPLAIRSRQMQSLGRFHRFPLEMTGGVGRRPTGASWIAADAIAVNTSVASRLWKSDLVIKRRLRLATECPVNGRLSRRLSVRVLACPTEVLVDSTRQWPRHQPGTREPTPRGSCPFERWC